MIRDLVIVALAQSAVCAFIAFGVLYTVNDRPVIALVAGVVR